jgi:hypothetical protein
VVGHSKNKMDGCVSKKVMTHESLSRFRLAFRSETKKRFLGRPSNPLFDHDSSFFCLIITMAFFFPFFSVCRYPLSMSNFPSQKTTI